MPFHYGGRFNQGLYGNQSFHNLNSTKGSNQSNQKFWQNKQNQGHQGGNQSWNNNRNNHNHNYNRNRNRHNRQQWQPWQTHHQNQNQNHHQNQQKNTPFHKQFQAIQNSNFQQESWTDPGSSSSSHSPSGFFTARGNTQNGLESKSPFSQSPFSQGDLNTLQLGQHNTFNGVSRDSHGDVVMADAPQMTIFSFRDHAEDLRIGAKRMMECASDLEGLASFMNSINQSFSPKEQFDNGVYHYD